jgi:hypothetical protein
MFGTVARHDQTHNISKIQLQSTCIFWDTPDLDFQFCIFHARTTTKTVFMIYESCSVFHKEYNKIVFAFFWLFYDFLRISQESANLLHYLRICSARRSSEVFDFLQMSPFFAQKPWKENTSCDVFHREAGGVAGQFPAGSPVLVAGQRRRSDPCSPRLNSVARLGTEKGTARGLDGARRRWPLELALRRDGGASWATRSTGRFYGA